MGASETGGVGEVGAGVTRIGYSKERIHIGNQVQV